MRSFFDVAVVDFDFLGVERAPRGGASGREPESSSARRARASFLMRRKRPSMES